MKNSLRIHKWTHNEFNIFILGVLTRPPFSTRVLHFSGTVFSICLHGLTYCINRLSFPVRASNSSQHQPLDVFAYHLDAFLVLAALRDYYVGVAFGWLDKLLMHGLEHVEIAV